MTDYEHLEKLLDTKMDALIELVRLELSNIRQEMKEVNEELNHHSKSNEDLEREFRGSIVREHARIDLLEERIKDMERTPKKLDFKKLIIAKTVEWSIPVLMLFTLWLFASGAIGNFIRMFIEKGNT